MAWHCCLLDVDPVSPQNTSGCFNHMNLGSQLFAQPLLEWNTSCLNGHAALLTACVGAGVGPWCAYHTYWNPVWPVGYFYCNDQFLLLCFIIYLPWLTSQYVILYLFIQIYTVVCALSFILTIPGCPWWRAVSHFCHIEEGMYNVPLYVFQECSVARSSFICQKGWSTTGGLLQCWAQPSMICCISSCRTWSSLVAF